MASEAFKNGNDRFVDEDYNGALKFYNDAISLDDANPEFFIKRAAAHSKLSNTTDALMDIESALHLDEKNAKALQRKGQLKFETKQFDEAKKCFEDYLAAGGDVSTASAWIQKCNTSLGLPLDTPSSFQKPPVSTTTITTTDSAAAAATAPASSALRIKHDWYQTDSQVNISILIKNVKPEDVAFQIDGRSLTLSVKLHTGSDYSLDLDLWGDVVASESSFKVMSTKIEVRLKKAKAIRWGDLEGDGTSASAPAVVMEAPKEYDPNARFKKWDVLAKDITEQEKNEKPQGDEALNALFKQIYADANEDTRRAMIKSYQESNGTVLSTNWSEVGKGKVETKPPSGMEFKKY